MIRFLIINQTTSYPFLRLNKFLFKEITTEMKQINRYLFKSIVSVLLLSAFFTSCQSNSNSTTQQSKYVLPDSLVKTLQFDVVNTAPLTNTVTLTGKVGFNEDKVAKIYPMVSGTIQHVKVMLGDYVSAGQVLGVIKSSEMAGFSNEFVNAQTNLSVAKKNLDATRDMYNSGLASQKDLLAAQAVYEQALSELSRVKRVLHINGGNTNGDYIVRSPVSGFVVEKFVTDNMSIRADNATNLFTIADLKNVWVIANVYESNIGLVHLNDNVNVTTLAYPGKAFKGKVDKIMNVLDPVNKVMKVRIVLPNPGYLLKPEMFAKVELKDNGHHAAMCVSSGAVVFDQSQNYVLVYKSPSDIRIVQVSVLNTIGNKTFISGNIQPGEKVIASQAILIYEALNS
ncbi:membrane fusion protein, cobalt-zinc-cadmium efflux system [Paludibacter jiangxiensis]|uniref:Membrane fusion protein, cobalt-zinc-cadmium efflux system n=2 Tax=Paludibacter jiangxiensis TaxID=681398 RepID=A0A171ADB9_9BACT|nr:membrane fusion protein, cobalt-zinc-cadmium efflux system [Paludibacter jiangxiensis]